MAARLRIIGVCAVTAGALSGCNEIPLLSNPTDRAAARLEIDLGDALYTGESVPLQWRLYDQNDRSIEMIPGWLTPNWSTSEPIVRLSGGRLDPLMPGEATLSLSIGGVSTTRDLRVNPGALIARIDAAYITQAVQRRDGTVPLVAGRSGYLRVFVTGDQINYFTPTVRARFSRNGVETVLTSTAARVGIPQQVAEELLSYSWNMPVPGSLIAPGTSLLVELDIDGGLRPAAGSLMRFPASGVPQLLDVRVVPTFRITFVPIDIIGFATGNVSPANVDYFMSATRAVWPLSETDVIVREPYSTSTRSLTDENWSDLLLETRMLRTADASTRYYHGILRREGSWSGLGYIGFPVAITQDGNTTWTVAHELGHNFNRRHGPCGGPAGVDQSYPHAGGGIGVYGLEADGITVHPPTRPDLMTYCTPRWVSDYSYIGVVQRLQAAPSPSLSVAPEQGAIGTMLMVSGEIGSSRPRLNPAFTLETAASLPAAPGPFTLEGRDAGGAVIFSISFAGDALGDGPEQVRQFAFAIPITAADAARVARISVTGGGANIERTGSIAAAGVAAQAAAAAGPVVSAAATSPGVVSLTWDNTRYPLVVVRNPATGSLLAMARGGAASIRTSAPELEFTVSTGVTSFVERSVIR